MIFVLLKFKNAKKHNKIMNDSIIALKIVFKEKNLATK